MAQNLDFFKKPQGISCKDGHVYVCDWRNNMIQVVSETGEFVRVVRTGDVEPWDVAVTNSADIIVVGDEAIHIYGTDNKHISTFGRRHRSSVPRLEDPRGITLNRQGDIVVADWETYQVHILRQTGKLVRTYGMFGGEGSGPLLLDGPIGVACLDDGSIAVVESGYDRVQMFNFDSEDKYVSVDKVHKVEAMESHAIVN